ncbi:hypothetical protein KY565_002618 [Salmonella enterica]|nr:hypothetical protein [Salmonella enterica]
MTVKVILEFTHTEDGIDVKSEVVPAAEGCCVYEAVFASTIATTVMEGVAEVHQEIIADSGFIGSVPDGCAH